MIGAEWTEGGVQIEGGDIAGISELVGLKGIDDIGGTVSTSFRRLEGSVWDGGAVVDLDCGHLGGWQSDHAQDRNQDEGDDDLVSGTE